MSKPAHEDTNMDATKTATITIHHADGNVRKHVVVIPVDYDPSLIDEQDLLCDPAIREYDADDMAPLTEWRS